MSKNSRIENSIKNSSAAIVIQVVSVILQFALRSVFIITLGIDYLGINGLFINILSVLSLSELGIGSAIIYSMYKPIAEGDYKKISQYMQLYKKVYGVIGIFIFIAGLSLIPFLGGIITGTESVGNIVLIYILFLINTIATYFFAHYRSLLTAYEKDYINNTNKLIFLIFQIGLQIIVLFVYKSFIFYLIIQLIMNLLANFTISIKVKKIYPEIIKNNNEALSKEEIKNILKNSIAMFSQKIGYVMLNSTDNIIISIFIGTTIVGVYSNYSLIIGTLSTLLSMVVSSVGASIGNLIASNTRAQARSIFLKINFAYFVLYGFCTVCLYNLIPDFISIWVGEELLLGRDILLIIIINFYISGMRQSVLSFTNASGVFWEMRYKALFEVAINLMVSIILTIKLGLIGVFLGTLISLITTSFWYEPYTLYKSIFKVKNKEYFKKYFIYTILLISINGITSFICSKIYAISFGVIIVKGIICMGIFFLSIFIFFRKTEEFLYFKNIFKNMFLKLKLKSK